MLTMTWSGAGNCAVVLDAYEKVAASAIGEAHHCFDKAVIIERSFGLTLDSPGVDVLPSVLRQGVEAAVRPHLFGERH